MALLATAGSLGTPGDGSGQTLALKARPAAASLLCDPVAPETGTTSRNPAEAERLINAATQAMILGDLSVAAEFLDQALQADPGAAEALYLRGRIAADRENTTAAVPWFCRYLSRAPDGASAAEARRRLDQAVEQGAGAGLLASFTGGVTRFEEGDPAGAEELFSAVIEERRVPEALYNRGLVRIALDRAAEGRADLVGYLELNPDAADRPRVEEALIVLAEDQPARSAGAAFFLGALFPGGGQYYTGRSGYGVLVTGLVAGAAATGYLYERTTIRCRAPLPNGECPPDSIAGEETERPILGPALGVAAGLMLISAIEAALHARGQTALVSVPLGDAGAARLELAPPPVVSGRSLSIHWLRIRH